MGKINVALKMKDFYCRELPALEGFDENNAEGIASFLGKNAFISEGDNTYKNVENILSFLRKNPNKICALKTEKATMFYLLRKGASVKTLPEYRIVTVDTDNSWIIQQVCGFQEVKYIKRSANGRMIPCMEKPECADIETNRRVIFPDEKESAFISKILSREPKTEAECFTGTITYTAVFADGYEMDIKCCGVEYREGESNLPWTEAVLFRNGGEVCCTEPSEEFFGKWEMEADGKTFEVIIEA